MQRSKIAQLPEGVRLELDRRIQSGGFANYSAVADWLAEKCAELGIEPEAVPSRSAIHAHGQKLEDIYSEILLEAQRSKAFGAAMADQQNEYGLSVLRKTLWRVDRLVERVYQAIEAEEIMPESIGKSIAPLFRVVSQVNKTLAAVEEHADKVRRQTLEDAASLVGNEVRSAGLSAMAAEEITKKILKLA